MPVKRVFNGAMLKKLRLNQNPRLNQSDLAEELGVTPQAIANWESHVNKPNPEFVEKLAEYFGIEPDDFYMDESGVVINGNKAIVSIISIYNDGTLHLHIPNGEGIHLDNNE